MRILVTGAGGQLGRALGEISDGEWSFTDVAELDITDEGAVRVFFERERPAVVVNCAACTDVDRAESGPAEREAAFRVNADAPRILARAAKATGAAMIHISTDFVFDGRVQRPYVEDDAPAPLNVYGESKLAGERAVLESGVSGAIVRTSWLYSPWGKNFVKAILGAAAWRDEIRVVADQWGCPTSAASLAGVIARVVATAAADNWERPAGIYHFCDAGVVSRAAFAEEIIRRADLSTRVVPVSTAEFASPGSARRPSYSALDTTKITRAFGVTIRPWQEALADVLRKQHEKC
ncbi:MAG: dTDP-4-dehydrorhamnose reductase [Alistipes sp.]|jgi:dTDP-4-dehydrorhamnose reductase|nr:dTDP-4-dehydrorhamnose reductase [Alistipes sp.]